MSDERLITPPPARMLAIPHEYLAICQRENTRKVTRGGEKGKEYAVKQADEVAAALLYLIERWTVWKIKQSEKDLKSGDVWVYFTLEQVRDYELCGAFGAHRIAQGFDLLVGLGFLSRRNNPARGIDRTYQYHFELEAVQKAVDALPPFLNIEKWKVQNQKKQSSKLEDAKSNIEGTIPHDPPQIPTQESEPTEQTSSPSDSEITGADGQVQTPGASDGDDDGKTQSLADGEIERSLLPPEFTTFRDSLHPPLSETFAALPQETQIAWWYETKIGDNPPGLLNRLMAQGVVPSAPSRRYAVELLQRLRELRDLGIAAGEAAESAESLEDIARRRRYITGAFAEFVEY